MTKLEEEIKSSLMRTMDGPEIWRLTKPELEERAKAAAEVAKKWIEKACHDLYTIGARAGVSAEHNSNYNYIGSEIPTKKWLKENGITE